MIDARDRALRQALDAETYATADIVAYDGEPRVKVGREFLLKKD